MAAVAFVVSSLLHLVVGAYVLLATGIVAACLLTASATLARDLGGEIRDEWRYDASVATGVRAAHHP